MSESSTTSKGAGGESTTTTTGTMDVTKSEQVHFSVSEYYGKTLNATTDLKTSACMIGDETSSDVAALLANVSDEIKNKFYGCGSPIPPLLASLTTLDLGCGSGRDTYVISQLIGPQGTAIGVDMTEEQLEVAIKHEQSQAKIFGFPKPNTMFIEGNIENLKKCGIKDNSVDVIVSNCVLNLASSKENVLRECFRVLKVGGELYFSDVYADRRIPTHLQQDKVLWGECLSGALYKGDFTRIMKRVGFGTYFIATSRVLEIADPTIKKMLGPITFYSETVRAFKLPPPLSTGPGSPTTIDDLINEDYGQKVKYNGSIPGFPHAFSLGLGYANVFITDQKTSVDAYTAHALANSRYASAFSIFAGADHKGAFGGGGGGGGVSASSSSAGSDGTQSASCCMPSSSSGSKSGCC